MMKDLPQNFSAQEAMQFIQTPAGQQLLRMLQQSSDQNLRRAKELVAAGDLEGAKKALQPLASSQLIQNIFPKKEGQ